MDLNEYDYKRICKMLGIDLEALWPEMTYMERYRVAECFEWIITTVFATEERLGRPRPCNRKGRILKFQGPAKPKPETKPQPMPKPPPKPQPKPQPKPRTKKAPPDPEP